MFVLYILWLFAALIQCLFWCIIFVRILLSSKIKYNFLNEVPVSVVICAKNEIENLKTNLPLILQQQYKRMEIILVNDASTDGTREFLDQLQKDFPKLFCIHLDHSSGKKNALHKGITAAQNEWILLTDADCYPSSDQWIRRMMNRAIGCNKKIILGYGPMRESSGFLNAWSILETQYVAIQYLSMALWRSPYMGVGRNLLYHKSIYENFIKQRHEDNLLSGDDDLLVNRMANASNTGVLIDKEALMFSTAENKSLGYYHQKNRQFSTGSQYKLKHQLLLATIAVSHFIFYGGLVYLIWQNFWFYQLIVIFTIRVFFVHFLFAFFMHIEKQFRSLPYVLLFDLFLPLYYLIFIQSILGWSKINKWK